MLEQRIDALSNFLSVASKSGTALVWVASVTIHSRESTWVGGGYTPDLTTGRWWTLSHRFERENRLFEGGTSVVDHVERLAVQVYAIGKDRIWTGRVFVDDIGWQ